jgi:uncharacterized membrane protein
MTLIAINARTVGVRFDVFITAQSSVEESLILILFRGWEKSVKFNVQSILYQIIKYLPLALTRATVAHKLLTFYTSPFFIPRKPSRYDFSYP